ncbi:hypothetical protein [Archangium lansingense]|uniref:Lipoprotein n=1 Tax=Archangium lansingense TaxID=2995310 RepID=A0ABT4AC79_9BACT|nr:hypothetical protein [Archangium lansinium]MCY1079265.1 hypothetical protein [Archangium lansinium]
MKMRMMAALATTALVGFGGANVAFNGTVDGHTLNVRDAAVVRIGDEESSFLMAVLSDQEGLCQRLQQQQQAGSSTELEFTLFEVGSELMPQGAPTGVYSVQTLRDMELEPGAMLARAYFHKRDANCNDQVADEQALGYSGSIHFQEPDANGLAHLEYDISFGSQNDRVTGELTAQLCDVVLSPPVEYTCQ